ncbi:12431_t:CDS:1, partial [Racocetra fulgida]
AEGFSNFTKRLLWITSEGANDLDNGAKVDYKMKIAWQYKEMKRFGSGIKIIEKM